mgnify:CR=1 FL=1
MAWGATWCAYCKRDYPELKRLSETGRYAIIRIDYDEDRELAKKYKVKRLPTYFIIEDEVVVFRTGKVHKLKSYKPKRTK